MSKSLCCEASVYLPKFSIQHPCYFKVGQFLKQNEARIISQLLGNRANPPEIWMRNSHIKRFKKTICEACLCDCYWCLLHSGVSTAVFFYAMVAQTLHAHCEGNIYVYSSMFYIFVIFCLSDERFSYLLDSSIFFFFLERLLKFHLVSLGSWEH